MGRKEIEEFLANVAVNENVAASTQNQALHAVLFLYKEVLKQDLDLTVNAVRAKKNLNFYQQLQQKIKLF